MSASRQLEVMRRRRSCKRKHRHPSRGAAEAHLRALGRTGPLVRPLVAYACEYCLGWHVGHR